MKKEILTLVILVLNLYAFSQQSSSDSKGGVLKSFKNIWNKANGNSTKSLTAGEIVAGLKEALSVGTNKSTDKLSTVDGFFKDAAIKILMPDEVKKIEKKMRTFGMGKLIDDAVLSMNRAAEDASKTAAPIFISAIRKMTIADGLSILKGTDTAATAYLRKSTLTELTKAFRPIVENSVTKVNATKYWKDVFTVYNKFSSQPVNTDLAGYVTDKALYGIFYYVAEEERKIRKNPAARITDILKKVFGDR